MSAYAFFDNVNVVDPDGLAQYKAQVGEVVQRFGGRYTSLGGNVEELEGDWRPTYPVLIEFPDLDSARRWYHSEEYAELKALRLASVRGHAVLIDGLGAS